MSTFNCSMIIARLDGTQTRELEALVDTGATYTVLPAGLLRDMGVRVERQARFEYADGRLVEMDLGQVWATINGVSAVTPVVFGEDGIQPLMGAVTMEILSLAVDPLIQRLVPTNGLL